MFPLQTGNSLCSGTMSLPSEWEFLDDGDHDSQSDWELPEVRNSVSSIRLGAPRSQEQCLLHQTGSSQMLGTVSPHQTGSSQKSGTMSPPSDWELPEVRNNVSSIRLGAPRCWGPCLPPQTEHPQRSEVSCPWSLASPNRAGSLRSHVPELRTVTPLPQT